MKRPRWLAAALAVAISLTQLAIAIPAQAAGELILAQAQLGNIFYDTQTVQIPVQTTGNTVDWSIKDGWGAVAGSGVSPVTGGVATIEPNLGRVGYFEIHIRSLQGSTVLAEADTSFAVVRQTSASGAASKFAVMTHFAQGWNTDLMPLITKAGIPGIRDEVYWDKVETAKGTYNFADFDAYFAAAQANGLDVMPPLTFGNKLYDWAERAPIWTVRRWVADVSGEVTLSGEYRRSSGNGDGTGVKILVDGNQVLDAATTSAATPYELTVSVSPGSAVDFVVTPGPGTEVQYDATTFTAQIRSGTSVVADSVADFSGVQGQSGWYYGRYVVDIHAGETQPLASPGFVQLAYDGTAWKSTFAWQSLDATSAHPGIGTKAKQYWASRRWISEVTGNVQITGSYKRSSTGGDGTGMKILVNGSQVWSTLVTNTTSTAYDITVPVVAGEPVELVITPADGRDVSYDAITFKAQIFSGTTMLADSSAEFSGVQGQSGWHYGYYTVSVPKMAGPASTAEFAGMPAFASNAWSSTQQWLKLDANGGHPAGAAVDGQGNASFTAPVTDAGRLGYANYGKAVLDHYPQVSTVEIWNEYNGSFCIGQCKNDRAGFYAEQLKKAYEVIKQAHPNVKVLGGATVMVGAGFNEDMFAAGALSYMDAFSYHPYNQWSRTWNDVSAYYDLIDLDNQIKAHNGGVSKPIWATEYGASLGFTTADRVRSAKYVTRMSGVLANNPLVEKAHLYLMQDANSGPGMGLVRNSGDPFGKYTPAPNYAAYSNLIHQLNGTTPLPKDRIARLSDVFSFPFAIPGSSDTVRMIWATGPKNRDILVWTDAPVTIVDLFGEEKVVAPQGGKVRITPSDSPVYVRGNVTNVTGTETPALADSVHQFSNVQGKDNWSYGFYDASRNFQQGSYTDFYWNWQWQLGADETLKVTRPGGFPSRVSSDMWAVRRWKCTVTKTLWIRGTMGIGGANNNNTFAILVEGVEVFSRTVTPADPKELAYEIQVPLTKDAKVDFVIKHAPGMLNSAADKQVFTARITET